MELLNMNFREFVEQDEKRTRIPVRRPAQQPVIEEEYEDEEDYQEPVRKSVKRVPSQEVEEYEDEDEEILDEEYEDECEDEEYYEEPVRKVTQRPVQQIMKHSVVQRPQPQYRPVQQSVQRQIQRPVQRPIVKPQRVPGYAMPDDQFRRPLAVSQKQLKESTIEGTANSLTEAIKRKVDTVFYRFGIQGLEKLDEKILDTIEELQYPESKQTKKPLREMRRIPGKKIIKKSRPLPLEQIKPVPQYEEPVYEEPIYEEPVSNEPLEEFIEEPVETVVQQEIEPEMFEEPVKVVKKPTSPKPKFMQPAPTPKLKEEPKVTGDVEEDMMAAALSMDFGTEKKEQVESVTDDEMWGTVEAILEAQPSQELVHEPQSQSALHIPQVEENTETNEETVEEVIEEPKPKRKRKVKQVETNTEETNTNEEA